MKIQIPFFVRQATKVALATKSLLHHDFVVEDIPMTVKTAIGIGKKSGRDARVRFFFGGGVYITVEMTSSWQVHGEEWKVTRVNARYLKNIGDIMSPKTARSEKTWQGIELKELYPKIWGSSPQI